MAHIALAVAEVGALVASLATGGDPTRPYAKQTPSEASFLQNNMSNVGALEVPGQKPAIKQSNALLIGMLCIFCVSLCLGSCFFMMMTVVFSGG